MVNITRIQLFGDVEGYLDVTEETIIPLTIAVSDIRDITSKTGTFSKSIKIKGTKNNNKLLNHYFDVNVEAGTFNINRRQECAIIQNGLMVLDNGIIQLISVNKIEKGANYDEQVEYTLLVKDATSDFFSIINSKYLDELDLFIPNLTYTAANVGASFNNTYQDGYKFVMPYNPDNYKNGVFNYNLEEFKPGIYARRYFDCIFQQATGDTIDSGFKYNFPDANDAAIQFNKLIIPYNGDEVKNNSPLSDVVVSATSNVTTVVSARTVTLNTSKISNFAYNDTSIPQLIKVNNEVIDTGGFYNPTTSTYTPPFLPSNGNAIQYDVILTYDIIVQNNDSVPVFSQNFYRNNENIVKDNSAISFVSVFGLYANNKYKKQLLTPVIVNIPNGISYSAGTTVIHTATLSTIPGMVPLTVNEGLTIKNDITFSTGANGLLRATFLKTNGNINTSSNKVFIGIRVTDIKVTVRNRIIGEYGFNVPLKFNEFIPTKIKQSDFIKGIFTMFNLYCVLDKDDPKKFNIYRRDGYYDSGTTKDWTYKLVKDDIKEVRFLPELTSKRLILSYKQDKDIPNENYETAINEVYGQQEFIFDNEYVKDVKRVEPIFSPTPMINNNHSSVVPMLIGNAPKTNIRILFDGGELPCKLGDEPIFQYGIINYSGATAVQFTTYPHISHWDKPKDPTFDINFGICDYYYRLDGFMGTNFITNNNLYNLHWKRTVNLINKGKMLIANFVLNERDINDLALNDKILVNNSWWNINKIIDYDANSNNPTKVELISFDDFEGLPFSVREPRFVTEETSNIRQSIWDLIRLRTPYLNPLSFPNAPIKGSNNFISDGISRIELNGDNNEIGAGSQVIFGDGNISNDTATIFGDANTNYFRRNVIFGSNNMLSGSTNRVFGDNNIIEDDNNIALGSYNVIPSGVTNAIMIGDGLTATTGNTLFTQNISMPSGGTISIGDTTFGDRDFDVLNMELSTGVYEFGGITINTGNTFNVGAAKGYSIDNTIPNKPIARFVDYSGVTGTTTPFLLTTPATFISLTSGGTLNLTGTPPDETFYRQNILLGVIGHPSGNLTAAGNRPDIIFDTADQFRDMFRPINLINDDVRVYGNSTDLSLANTAGKLYGLGIGFVANGKDNPTVINVPAGTPTTFQYRTQTGGTFSNTTLISAATYDVGGVATTVPNPTATATNQRIYLLQNGAIRIQFGQNTYSNLAAAIAAASTENFVVAPNSNLGILIGILSIQKNCTNLNDTTTCRFLSVSKFGESVGSAGGIATGNLQSTYNNSTSPEITTNSSLGALSLVRGSASDTDAVFETYNGAIQLKTRIDGNGSMTGQSFVKSGGTASQFLMADGSTRDTTTISEIKQINSIITPAGTGGITFAIGNEFTYDWNITISGASGGQKEHRKVSVFVNTTGNTANQSNYMTNTLGTPISITPNVTVATNNVTFDITNNSAGNIYVRSKITII